MKLLQSALGVAAIAIFSGGLGAEHLPSTAPAGFSPAQRQVADEIISIFENDTPELQYAYIQNLHDGRGYTAGRGGFTSATGDMLSVLQAYGRAVPGSSLSKYIPLLSSKQTKGDDDVSDLAGLPTEWSAAAQDPLFRKAQDAVVDEQVFDPALKHWREEGCRSPAGLLILYDTVMEHGDGNDADSARAILEKAKEMAGGNPASGVKESEFLHTVLSVRRSDLIHPADAESMSVWAASVSRCDALEQLLDSHNMDLATPLELTVFNETWRITPDGGHRVD